MEISLSVLSLMNKEIGQYVNQQNTLRLVCAAGFVLSLFGATRNWMRHDSIAWSELALGALFLFALYRFRNLKK